MKTSNSTEMKVSFKNATITLEEDGSFKIVEYLKDGEKENSLTKVIKEQLLDVEGLTITFGKKEVDEEEV